MSYGGAYGPGGTGGWETVVYDNGYSAFYVYYGAGGGFAARGVGSYTGDVYGVSYPGMYNGGFVNFQASFGVGYSTSISPSNGATSSGLTWGGMGVTVMAEDYHMLAGWW